jgi:CBS domain-containing protein
MQNSPTIVEALMSPQPVSLDSEATIQDAFAMLERYPFRHLPVEQGNRLVGIVSDRDLALAGALPRGRRVPGQPQRQARRVKEVMHDEVRCVAPQTPAHEAAELLLDHRIGALPVVVSEERLVGIVTESDFLRLFVRGEVGSPEAATEEEPVAALMNQPVLTTHPGEDLMDAAERLLSSHVRHLPVVAADEIVGMLSDRDVRRGLARLAREDRGIEARGERRVPTLKVLQVMSKPCMTVEAHCSLHSAAHTMLECRIGALPVVEGNQLLGILTQTDLLRRYRDL